MFESIKKGFGLMIGVTLADFVIFCVCDAIAKSNTKKDKAEV